MRSEGPIFLTAGTNRPQAEPIDGISLHAGIMLLDLFGKIRNDHYRNCFLGVRILARASPLFHCVNLHDTRKSRAGSQM